MIYVSDELQRLSKEMVETIKEEDKEFNFKQNRGYVERNVPALKYKKSLVGLNASDIDELISNQKE